MWIWLLPLLVVCLLLLGPRWTRARCTVTSKAFLFSGQKAEAQVQVVLQTWVPLYARLEGDGSAPLGVMAWGGRAIVWGRWRLEDKLLLLARRRGEYHLPGVRVFVRDLLGVLEREVHLSLERGTVVVYPEVHPVLLPHLKRTLLADGHPAEGGMEDATRFVGVRAYTPGDPLRHLHWKATARYGQLMMREFERVKSSAIWLHLDLQGEGRIGEVYLEHAASLAASLLRAAFEEGLAVGLSLGDKAIPVGLGATHEQRLLAVLGRARPQQNPMPVPDPDPGINLILVTMLASAKVLEGALRARARTSQVHLVALPEGFFLWPGERGRRVFGMTDGVQQLLRKRNRLVSEGVQVHILRGNQSVLGLVHQP
ncbi:DUF58 domain-containing protein [Meiothermus sp.]|uniref:DUF58 domain-containing protein n=1 Tax=Meiothermus sp. TaxID=1955249 RepID=UPI00307F9AD0